MTFVNTSTRTPVKMPRQPARNDVSFVCSDEDAAKTTRRFINKREEWRSHVQYRPRALPRNKPRGASFPIFDPPAHFEGGSSFPTRPIRIPVVSNTNGNKSDKYLPRLPLLMETGDAVKSDMAALRESITYESEISVEDEEFLFQMDDI